MHWSGRDSVRYLGFVQMIRQLYASPTQATGRASNPLPSTALVLRRNLNSVTLLANTLTKLECVQAWPNLLLALQTPYLDAWPCGQPVCLTKLGGCCSNRTNLHARNMSWASNLCPLVPTITSKLGTPARSRTENNFSFWERRLCQFVHRGINSLWRVLRGSNSHPRFRRPRWYPFHQSPIVKHTHHFSLRWCEVLATYLIARLSVLYYWSG